jgi:autotransporter-associated beta strand protein
MNSKPTMHRKPFLTLLIALVPLVIASTGNAAATYYSRANGDWNVNTTWSTTSGGSAVGAGIYPVAGDTVIIEGSFTVTVTATEACGSVQLGSSVPSASPGALTFSGASPSLAVSGAVLLGSTTDFAAAGTVTFTSGSTLTAGSLTLGGTVGSGTLTMTAGGTLIAGSLAVGAAAAKTWTPGTGTVILTGTTTLPSTIFTTFNNLTLSGSANTTTSVGITVTGTTSVSGTLTLSGANTFSSGVTLNSGGTLNLNSPTALNGATLTINGGTLGNTSAGDITLSPNSPQNWNGSFAYAGGTHSLNLGTGAVLLVNNCAVTVNGNTLTVGGAVSGTSNLTKAGPGTLTLTGDNTYTGTTTIKQGMVKLNGQTGHLADNSGITFTGTGMFNYDNVGAGGSLNEVVGALTLSGGDATIQSTRTIAQIVSLTFSSLAARPVGAVGNFVNSGGTGTSQNQIILKGQALGFINQGTFYGGTSYAFMNGAGTYVRSIDYGKPDLNAINVNGGNTIGANSGKHVQIIGAISAQTDISILTLRIAGNYDFTLAANQTLTLSSGGLLKAYNSAATLSGGKGLTTGGSTELVIRTDQASDSLTISIPILSSSTGGLTKSGAGTLILSGANTYTGDTTVNAGTLDLRTAGGLSDADKLLLIGTAVVNLGFSGTDTIGGLVFDGVPQAVGTWGSTTSSATHKDARFTGSGMLNVDGATTTTIALTAGSNPSTYGDSLTFTATVSGTGGIPTGDVTFKDGAITLGTAALNASGVATFSINTLSAGAHSAIAAFYVNSTSPNLSQTVNTRALSITPNPDSKTYGQTKTYGSGQTAFTIGAGELIVGDSVSSVTLTCTDGAPATAAAGSYAIVPTGAVGTGLANYNITYHNGTLTVMPAATANAVVSSLNPARPGSNVTFTATLSAVPPGAGTPTGMVQFLTNGHAFVEPVALLNGQASITTALLPHGSNSIAVEYAGDGNFFGKTNSLSPAQVVNTPPVKGTFTLGAIRNQNTDFSATKLAKTAVDADHDPLAITAVMGLSAQGGTVTLNGSTIRYTPPADLVGLDVDTLYYTVSDGFGGADTTGTIVVTIRYADAAAVLDSPAELPDGNKRISASGIPGHDYLIQATTSTTDPASWVTIGTNAADSCGKSVFCDLNATNYNFRYYRIAAP